MSQHVQLTMFSMSNLAEDVVQVILLGFSRSAISGCVFCVIFADNFYWAGILNFKQVKVFDRG